MVVVDTRGAQGEHALGDAAIDVGEQRVVAHARRERSLGQTAHEDAVEVEPEAQRHVPHQHAVAEPAHSAEVVVELELERAAEDVEPRRGFDRVEAGEALERRLDLVGGLLLGLGPHGAPGVATEVVVHEAARPLGEVAPARARVAPAASAPRSSVTNASELARRRELVLVPLGPRFAVGHRELLGELALERRARDARVGRATVRCRAPHPRCRLMRSQRADGTGRSAYQIGAPASSAITSWRWKSRSGRASTPSSDAPEHALGQRAHRGAVVRDAGGVELFVDEARRTARPRRTGSPCARGARRRRSASINHPDDGADFVVGIGHRHHRGGVGHVDPTGGCEREPQTLHDRGHTGIGARDAGDPGDDGDRRALADRAQQRGAGERQFLREVHDESTEVVQHRRVVARSRRRPRP